MVQVGAASDTGICCGFAVQQAVNKSTTNRISGVWALGCVRRRLEYFFHVAIYIVLYRVLMSTALQVNYVD